MATRYNINDFALANPAYAGGTVSFYTVSGGAKTATLATLYAASTGTTTLANPRTLDSDGKFSVPVYVEVPVIATVSGLTVADHDTGIMGLAEGAASTSAAAAAVSAAAALVSENNAETAETNSAASAAAALVSENNAAATLAGALLKAGDNMTGGINSARGNITQHATTMDFFAVTSPDILDGTGSAVTITACVNAPQAGATRKFYPIVATVLTHGATFDIAGNANLTAAAGDCWIIEAKTVSTYRVTAVKEDGTAVVAASISGSVVQRVEATPYTTYSTSAANIPFDDTIPQITEGSEYLTVAITPTSATNRLVIRAQMHSAPDAAGTSVVMALFQDATANALAVVARGDAVDDNLAMMSLTHEMAAGTTSATTFRIRTGTGSGSIHINGRVSARVFGGALACRLSVEEIKV